MVNVHNITVAKDHTCAAMVGLACAEVRGDDQKQFLKEALERVRRAKMILEVELAKAA